jgi:hypothetical protein
VRHGVQFSREKGNLLNLNTRRQSGFQNNTVDVAKKGLSSLCVVPCCRVVFLFFLLFCVAVRRRTTRSIANTEPCERKQTMLTILFLLFVVSLCAGKGLVVSFKSKKNAQKPKKLYQTSKLARTGRNANSAIRALTKQANRPELTRAALGRASKLAAIKSGRVKQRASSQPITPPVNLTGTTPHHPPPLSITHHSTHTVDRSCQLTLTLLY